MLSVILHFSLAWYKYSSLKFSGPQIVEGQMTPLCITGPPVLKRIITYSQTKIYLFPAAPQLWGGKKISLQEKLINQS